ncbi:MAG: flagellar export chaperone FliS [Chthoniobacteraceae bacterium]|nr:flagellar export chaperone FliS [Chthoniobacteraceae bacterium]
MQLARFAKSYQSVAVTTATPGQLVLMLFDGALRFMAAAENGFGQEDLRKRNETIHNNIGRAQDILRELQCSLDMSVPGDFSPRMYALYDFMVNQLHEANMKKELAPIATVSRLLGEIRDAWAQMLEKSVAQVA